MIVLSFLFFNDPKLDEGKPKARSRKSKLSPTQQLRYSRHFSYLTQGYRPRNETSTSSHIG